MLFSLPSIFSSYKKSIFPIILPSLLPLTSITLTASLYCVIAIAVERYLHLTGSLQRNKVNISTTPMHVDLLMFHLQGSFFGYILPVLVFSTVYNVPKFFELTTEYQMSKDGRYVEF